MTLDASGDGRRKNMPSVIARIPPEHLARLEQYRCRLQLQSTEPLTMSALVRRIIVEHLQQSGDITTAADSPRRRELDQSQAA
jgi:hypothetical protein